MRLRSLLEGVVHELIHQPEGDPVVMVELFISIQYQHAHRAIGYVGWNDKYWYDFYIILGVVEELIQLRHPLDTIRQ